MKTISKIMLAVAVLGGLVVSVQASVISDCTYSRYAYMGGSTATAGKNYMLVGDMDASYWGYAWLQFETPSETVSNAYLNLQSIAQSAGMWNVPESSPVVISVYAVSADVTTIGSTYTAAEFKSLIGDAIASVTIGGGDTIYSWDITDLVNSWVNSGINYGLVISIDGVDDSLTYAKFGGVSAVTGAPTITDVAMGIPEPTTMALLGIGALMFGRNRRMR